MCQKKSTSSYSLHSIADGIVSCLGQILLEALLTSNDDTMRELDQACFEDVFCFLHGQPRALFVALDIG